MYKTSIGIVTYSYLISKIPYFIIMIKLVMFLISLNTAFQILLRFRSSRGKAKLNDSDDTIFLT